MLRKPNLKTSILFVSFLFSFFTARINTKCVRSLRISGIPNDFLANLLHCYLFWASCELRVESGLKTSLSRFAFSCVCFLAFSHHNCVGLGCMVTPQLDYWALAVIAARSITCSLLIFLYQLSLLETHLGQQRTLLRIYLVGVSYSEASMIA